MAEKKKGKLKKLLLVGVVGCAGLLALGFGGLYVTAQAQLDKDVTVPEGDIALLDGDKDAIQRGEYLVTSVMGCSHNDCHRADFGGGPVVDEQPMGRIYART